MKSDREIVNKSIYRRLKPNYNISLFFLSNDNKPGYSDEDKKIDIDPKPKKIERRKTI